MPSRAHASAKGVVLCGGEGARLRPLTFYFQKTILPVGSSQRPVLEFVLRLLRHHGIREVVLLVGYKHEQIMNYFGHGERLGVRLTYVVDDPALRGTGGSLLNAYQQGVLSKEDRLLIYYADILSDIDLSEMLAYHERTGAVATLAVSRGYRVPVGVAWVDGEGRLLPSGWPRPGSRNPLGPGSGRRKPHRSPPSRAPGPAQGLRGPACLLCRYPALARPRGRRAPHRLRGPQDRPSARSLLLD